MNIVVLMAGNCSRFAGSKFGDYKPFITVKHQSIIEWTLSSIGRLNEHRLFFVIREDHNEKYQVKEALESNFFPCEVLVLDKPTRGNLETAWLASWNLPITNDDPILFLDSDNFFQGGELFDFINRFEGEFALISSFEQWNPEPKWCFAQTRNHKVLSIKEKDLSCGGDPMVGVFYFSKLSLFLTAAEVILEGGMEKGEFYMSQTIDWLIRTHTPVYNYLVEDVIPLGTPEDVDKFINKKRIVIDLDKTINTERRAGQYYWEVEPLDGAVEALQTLKKAGHEIILHTSRGVARYNHNEGKMIAKQAPIIIDWLRKHEIPFDELHFGKPLGDFYIDDKAIRFHNWEDTLTQL